MNDLLIFFALPVATVILAIVLQKILKCPLLVAGTFFAIYLIVTFSAFDASFLVYAILYTILAYVTAVLTKAICNFLNILASQNNGCYRIIQRPISINNNRPCTSINLANEENLISDENYRNLENERNYDLEENTSNFINESNSIYENGFTNQSGLITKQNQIRKNNCNCKKR